jgi:hypothetical protein
MADEVHGEKAAYDEGYRDAQERAEKAEAALTLLLDTGNETVQAHCGCVEPKCVAFRSALDGAYMVLATTSAQPEKP